MKGRKFWLLYLHLLLRFQTVKYLLFHLIHSYNTIFKYAIFPNTVFNGGVAYFHKKRGATNAASLCLTISIMSFSFRQENVVFRNHFRKSSYSFHWRNKKTNFEGTYKNKEKNSFYLQMIHKALFLSILMYSS